MRWRVMLWISLGLNLLLALGWAWSAHRLQSRTMRSANSPAAADSATPTSRTNVLVRRQFFSWQELESDDYTVYIANLRAIGCPEQTVRDIIIADVNALYAKRRATEIVTPEQQWWRPEPDSNVLATATAKLREMEEDRKDLLTNLLGPGWESGDQLNLPRPSRTGMPLDGPVLGFLNQDAKERVQEISNLGSDRAAAYIAAQNAAGKPVDPAELARLRQQTREQLAAVLTPPQLEEFLLRYSQSATTLRTDLGQLKYFNATADEFRAIFRATDPIDMQLQQLTGATDAASTQQRVALLQQKADALRLALGADRYQQYVMLHDPVFQDAYAAALKAGNPDSAEALYEIRIAAEEEQSRIKANTNFTAEQRAIEQKRAELEQLKATAQALGQQLPPERQSQQQQQKPPPRKTHVLVGTENVDVLARLYGVNPDAIRAANPTLNFNRLRPGDNVYIPIISPSGSPIFGP